MTTWLPFLAVYLAGAVPGKAPDVSSPRFKITTGKADDSVQVQPEKEKTPFVVRSPSGISQAVIERLDNNWPKAVVLRLHLKGLSTLRVTSHKLRLDAVVEVKEGKARVRQWKDGKEMDRLDEKSPLWMDIRIRGGAGKPATEPLRKGEFFEVALPPAFFAGNPTVITLSWVDFYR